MLTETRLQPIGSKKLLAVDGGGIRGVLSLEVLEQIEDNSRQKAFSPRLSGFPTISIISQARAPAASSPQDCRPACRSTRSCGSTSMRVRKCS